MFVNALVCLGRTFIIGTQYHTHVLNKVWFLDFHIYNWFPDISEDRSELVGNSDTGTPGSGLFCENPISSQQGPLEVVPSLYAETQPQGF